MKKNIFSQKRNLQYASSSAWIAGADKARGPDNEQDGYAKVYDLRDEDWIQKGSTINGTNESRTGAAVAMS